MNDDEDKSYRHDDARHQPRVHVAPLAASIAAHAALIGAIIFFAKPIPRPHGDWVLAYLVEIGDGRSGGGSAHSAASGARTVSAETGPVALPKPAHRNHARASMNRSENAPPHREVHVDEIASRNPAPAISHIDPAQLHASGDSGDLDAVYRGKFNRSGDDSTKSNNLGAGSGSGTGSGAGAGNGSGGTTLANADYGTNPPPTYPAIARRHEEQGTVTLRVLVGADGQAERVEISESSGFDVLDDSAVETVAKKWRFAPARRDGIAFESWVLVPIRFALTEANSRR